LYVGLNGPLSSKEGRKSQIVRYTIERDEPHRLLKDSALTIIEWESDGHNGVAITFGLDGMLYVTSGDGTSDSDTNLKGQGLDHLLAKVLRIDVDQPDGDRPYSVPRDNPFVGQANVRPETWAYGLRNPWRMTTDRETGAIWVGNNGQDLWEQVYRVERGDNYGWSVYEGNHPFYLQRQLGPTPHVRPTLEHPHSEARSLTGGVVYYGQAMPELRGAYIYGDYSTGKIWGARHDGQRVTWHQELADTTLAVACIDVDADGELLIVDHRGGDEGGFYRFVPNQGDSVHDPAAFPRKLSETGLFQSVAGHRVQPSLIPYSVNAPLWSDGTYKERYMAIPGDSPKITMRATGGWDFPNGTVLVKSFALEAEAGNPATRRWIETRLLTRQDNEWVGYTYQWNDEQTEATLVDKQGLDLDFAVVEDGEPRKLPWHYPSRTECMVCHSRAANFVLGPSTVQMNRTHDYGGFVDNQLRVLEHLGLLQVDATNDFVKQLRQQLSADGLSDEEATKQVDWFRSPSDQRKPRLGGSQLAGATEHYPRLVDPYDESLALEQRARSYLHANCAHCHIGAGGGNAQIDLAFATKLSDTKALDERPLHDTFGIDDPRIIAPGDPRRSVLLHRVSIRDRGQMPQLATTRPDAKAVKLIEQWIEHLAKPAAEPKPNAVGAKANGR
ncbi:MAG: PQQ-dependent sugar dehydrogenase, partial [Planctomycetales bacterium]|nr:PQQ-dependent sugar dehydrogenase [Planctomycetales bacterium]